MATFYVKDYGRTADQLAAKYGGYWGEHPGFPLRDWQHETAEDYTRLGYWDWVVNQLEQEAEELERDSPYRVNADI